jgi:general secretion pathway protein D
MKFFNHFSNAILIGMLLLSFSALHASEPQVRERVNLKLENIKIEDFIKMVGKVVDKNILLSQPIPGTVNFVSSSPIYKDELMDILLTVLSKKGFTIVQNGSFFTVERANTAVKRNLPIGSDEKNLMKTEFIQVDNENVDIIAAKVRQFLSEGGKLLTIKETNTMIVSDFPDNISIIEKVVRKVESQREINTQVEFVTLKNAKASRISAQLQKIGQSLINQKVEANKVEILSDDASNSIIILASENNIETLRPIVAKLDAKDTSADQRLTILPLENSEAKNVVTSLQTILDKKKYAKETDKPMVSVYEELNAIVVSATEADIEDIKGMIKVLDVEKPQVFVKARIIEISNTESDQIGLRYGLSGGAITSSGLLSFAANLGGASMVLPTGLNLDTSTKYSEGIVFGATLDFLAGNGAAQSLSEPTLLCVNNQESIIYVGQTQSIVTSTVQGNQSTDLARNTVSREDIGLTLKIKPRLSSGDKVTLIANTKLEDVLPGSQAGYVNTSKREVTTTAIVQNGESVIIGGLISDKERKSNSGIPLLREIPYLGALFGYTETTKEEINLVIILTPYIVRNNEDLPRVRKLMKQLDEVQKNYELLLGRKLDERLQEIEAKKAKDAPAQKQDALEMVSPSGI